VTIVCGVALPENCQALADALPDVPRWVETRSLLRAGECELTVGEGGHGAIVVDPGLPWGAVIGHPDGVPLQEVLVDAPSDFELIVQMDALDEAAGALCDWNIALAILHSQARPRKPDVEPGPDVHISAPPDPCWVKQPASDVWRFARYADAAAVCFVEGRRVVSICTADVTESADQRTERRARSGAALGASRPRLWETRVNVADLTTAFAPGWHPASLPSSAMVCPNSADPV